ncbi:Rha family transcriptional regulator [Fusobacterium polymorphum]|uniref:Rha family transcriptional regulator n=1 Tax=Fusobacterium nucleatum subsp. polymorphum TaxID=76857 RepID=UPI0021C483E3|nr:Rha family transcriptional regulator [Fusobacterium polymorphum]
MGELIAKIENINGILVVSSRVIAKQLGKRHEKVLRDLDKILINPHLGRLKNQSTEVSVDLKKLIIPNYYRDSKNRTYREYLLTKDGFTLYMFNIQGYNDFKMNYINKFNRMEQALINEQHKKWLSTRQQGKITRKHETDSIKMLMEYANIPKEKQHLYYMTYSKLPFIVLGMKKVSRDNLPADDLNLIKELERIIQMTILTSIIKGLEVKAIYQECKKACNEALENTEQKLIS